MSKGMLGLLKLSVVRGPLNDLNEKLASSDGPKWLEKLKRFLREVYTISGDDDRSPEELLRAGCYRKIRHEVEEWLTLGKWGGLGGWDTGSPEEVDLELFQLDYDPTEEQVKDELNRRGLKEPTIGDALRFGEKYPDLQRDGSIVFLHWTVPLDLSESFRDWPHILVLGVAHGVGRDIDVMSLDDGFTSYYRFAGRRPRN